jgi:hypothetical protein
MQIKNNIMNFSKSKLQIFCVLLLFAFAFSFAHSELDNCKASFDDHSHHDYKILVKTTIIQNTQVKQADILKTIAFVAFTDFYSVEDIINYLKIGGHEIVQNSPPYLITNLFILQGSLLI